MRRGIWTALTDEREDVHLSGLRGLGADSRVRRAAAALGESPVGLGGAAGPGIGKDWPLVRECFSLYFWGEFILPPERADDVVAKLLLNGFTSLLWGLLAGRLITWIAARQKRRYKGKNEREYS